jgi:hypothetical protein
MRKVPLSEIAGVSLLPGEPQCDMSMGILWRLERSRDGVAFITNWETAHEVGGWTVRSRSAQLNAKRASVCLSSLDAKWRGIQVLVFPDNSIEASIEPHRAPCE